MIFLVCYLMTLSVSELHSIDDRTINEYGVGGGMRIGRVNQRTRREHGPVPLCPPQLPRDLTWNLTRATAIRSRRLTA
jgi:hypothetical protein